MEETPPGCLRPDGTRRPSLTDDDVRGMFDALVTEMCRREEMRRRRAAPPCILAVE